MMAHQQLCPNCQKWMGAIESSMLPFGLWYCDKCKTIYQTRQKLEPVGVIRK